MFEVELVLDIQNIIKANFLVGMPGVRVNQDAIELREVSFLDVQFNACIPFWEIYGN